MIFWLFLAYRGFDNEMRAVVAKNLEGRGIKLHSGTNLTEVCLDIELNIIILTVGNVPSLCYLSTPCS